MKRFLPLLLLILPLLGLPSPARSDVPLPVQVMFVGSYHFGNPGRDLHNVAADDMTAPRRQKELAELAQRLERFKPTAVAVEVSSPDLKVAAYRKFTPADLGKAKNEIVQVGYRIAHDVGLAEVYAIDEDSDTIDYFPWGKIESWAKDHKADATKLAAMQARVEKMTSDLTAAQKTKTVSELFAQVNDPAGLRAMQDDFQYGLMAFGDAKAQPGAELNAAWYLRNAKIFAKLTQVAKPGDRVIIVFGSGHGYWLRHFIENTPGFQLVEPVPYLTKT
jgi:hypothetical protein